LALTLNLPHACPLPWDHRLHQSLQGTPAMRDN
jgi:hypothetical protein